MAQYIDKGALVAEIEKLIKHYNESAKEFGDEGYNDNVLMEQCKANACNHILSFLDTLEMKEVDLEKEIDTQWNKFVDSEGEVEQFSDIAKHFFELGIEKSVNESIIRKIVDLNDEAAKHYDSLIKKENKENGFSQLAIDLFEHNIDAKELCIQYIIENLKSQEGE